MESLYQHDIFYEIFDYLSFSEIVPLRLVCTEWKEYVDCYFRNSTTLCIIWNGRFSDLRVLQWTMGYNLYEIRRCSLPAPKLIAPAEYLKDLSVVYVSKIVKLFPNILRFYFLNSTAEVHMYALAGFVKAWPNLIHLQFFFNGYLQTVPELVESIKKLQHLKSLSFPAHAHYFKKNWRPFTPDSLVARNIFMSDNPRHPDLKKLEAIAFPKVVESTFYRHLSRFKNLQVRKMSLHINFESEYDSRYSILEFMDELSLANPNLEVAEFWSLGDRKSRKSDYKRFLEIVNMFPNLKKVRFDLTADYSFLAAIFKFCPSFLYIDEIHIDFRQCNPNTYLNMPNGFNDILPYKPMKNLKKIYLRPMLREGRIQITSTDFFISSCPIVPYKGNFFLYR